MIAAATEPLLGILKYVLLALLYLFFARVLWAVWSEVRAPQGRDQRAGAAPASRPRIRPSPHRRRAHGAAARQARRASLEGQARQHRAVRRASSRRLTKGTVFAIGDEITIGRAATCTHRHGRRLVRLAAARPRVPRRRVDHDRGSRFDQRHLPQRQATDRAERLAKGDRVQIGNTVFEAE